RVSSTTACSLSASSLVIFRETSSPLAYLCAGRHPWPGYLTCLSEPEDDFLGATDPCAGRPMNPRSGSSDECRKFSQRPPTARIRLRAGAKVATGGKPRQAQGRAWNPAALPRIGE